MKAKFFLSILLGVGIFMDAQVKIYHHNVAWGRIVFSDTLNAKIKWEIYLQQRTQNNVENKVNLFNERQFTSYWLWFNYDYSRSWRFSFSPLGYFDSRILIVNKADEDKSGIKEFRWSIRAEQINKHECFTFFNRFTLEYRLRDISNNNVYLSNFRARLMFRAEKKIFSAGKSHRPVTLDVNDELMLQFGESVKNNPSVFDQNRIYCGFSYEFFKNIKFKLGYLFTVQQRPSGDEFDHINTIWGILTFDNVFSQFNSKRTH